MYPFDEFVRRWNSVEQGAESRNKNYPDGEGVSPGNQVQEAAVPNCSRLWEKGLQFLKNAVKQTNTETKKPKGEIIW